MRFGELGGLVLGALLWLYPLALLLALGATVHGDLPTAGFFATLLLGFLWPGTYLLSRRLREPADLDVVEADGRAPVLIVHPPTVRGVRGVLPTPSLFRDMALWILIGGLRKSLRTVGPILRLERPRPPPDHGPVASMENYEAHLRTLLGRARSAALVVNVVDGSEANELELARTAEAIDVRRIVVVPPPDHLRRTFIERWKRLRERLPGLPALEGRTAAVRFGPDAHPHPIMASSPSVLSRRLALARPNRIVRPGERSPEPKPPAVTWLLSLLPLAAAFVSLVVTPIFLREHGLSYGTQEIWMLTSLGCAVVLVVLSRRVMRLVPGSELPMVLVAATPWVLSELISLTHGGRLSGLRAGLRDAGQGAAFAAPLLLTTAVVLAGAAVVRRSHGRSVAFGIFGLAAVIPFVALTLGLADHADTGGLIGVALLTGLVIGGVAYASSGDAGRRHAPFPIGAAVSAALALAGWATTVTHGAWRSLPPTADSSSVATLLEFDQVWSWFILLLALVPVAVGAMFRGRFSHVTTNSLALLLLAALLISATDAHVARGAIVEANDRVHPDRFYVEAVGPREEFVPITFDGLRPLSGPAALALDRSGAHMGGERVASAVQLSGYGAQGTPRMARAIADTLRGQRTTVLRVAVTADVRPEALLAVCRAAWSLGAEHVQIAGLDLDGQTTSIDLRPPSGPHQIILSPRAAGFSVDAERATDYANRVTVIPQRDTSLHQVLTVLSTLHGAGFTHISLGPGPGRSAVN